MADKTAVYEGLFILDANRLARDREGLPQEVNSMIENSGGEIEISRLWEERRLAYPIKGHRKGAYWIAYFHLPPTRLGELTRQCELNEGVLRQLFVRLPAALVEPILEHAKGNTAAAEEATEDAEETEQVEVTAS